MFLSLGKEDRTIHNQFLVIFLTTESVNEILKCDHSNESYIAVLSCSVVYHDVQGVSKFREGRQDDP